MKRTEFFLFILLLAVGFALSFAAMHEPVFAASLETEAQSGSIGPQDMILIPAGEFPRGCNPIFDKDKDPRFPECHTEMKPYRQIYLDDYYIDKFEVTVDQYAQCVRAGKCSEYHLTFNEWPDKKFLQESKYCNWRKPGEENHPINCVDWRQAKAYCEWAGKRLPTEAEWEKAARGTDDRVYPWGGWKNPEDKYDCHKGNFDDEKEASTWMMGESKCDGFQATAPVGSFPAGASPYGVMDMTGNVWEWVADWYDENYYKNSPSENPPGPSSGQTKSLRGGSWASNYSSLRIYVRSSYGPAERYYGGGFRCAK